MLEWVGEAKEAGFRTHVAFIAAGDADNHVNRVQARVQQGGHVVPAKEVRDIHAASMNNLVLLAEAASTGTIDRLTIYDNEQQTGLAVVDVEQGRVRIEREAPQWLTDALAQTPFKIENLQLAKTNRLTLADLDRGSAIRTEALAKELTLPIALEYMDVADYLGEKVIRDDLETIRGALLRNRNPNELVRSIATSHGYNSELREYADTLVTAVETQLATELAALKAIADEPINPTLERRGALLFWQEQTPDHQIKHASGPLMVPGTNTEKRDLYAQRQISQGTGDHAGHLIGHQFGGPETPANLSLQSYGQNQGGGTYWSLERDWADKLKAGIAIDVHVREMTHAGEDRPYHRHVEWTETHPDGKTIRDSLDFMNATTERTRAARGEISVPVDGRVIDITPTLAAQVEQIEDTIAVQLSPAQVRGLLQNETPADREAQKAAYGKIIAGDEPVAVMEARIELDYSDDNGFFALLSERDKPALDARLTELETQKTASDKTATARTPTNERER